VNRSIKRLAPLIPSPNHAELDSPAAGILHRVTRDLRRGGGDARLVELGEAQERGDLASPLAGQYDVVFDAYFKIHEGHVHVRPPLS
jgi:hypothetical protein